MKGCCGVLRCGVVLEDGLEEDSLAAIFLLSLSPEPLWQGADKVLDMFGNWGTSGGAAPGAQEGSL